MKDVSVGSTAAVTWLVLPATRALQVLTAPALPKLIPRAERPIREGIPEVVAEERAVRIGVFAVHDDMSAVDQ